MEQALDNMAALPIWAKVLLVAVALMPWVVTLRARVKARREEAEGEYEAWRRVLGPRGWIGRRGRGASTRDTWIEFEDTRSETTRRLRVTGRHGDGELTLYGSLSGVRLELDLTEAREVGVLAALRPTRRMDRLAVFLDREVEDALTALPEVFAAHARAHLSIRKRLELTWDVPPDRREGAQGVPVEDRRALFTRSGTLERGLMGCEGEDVDSEALVRAMDAHGPIGATLATRALLTFFPDGDAAREVRASRLGPDATRGDVEALIGCVFDPDVLRRHDVTADGHVAWVQAMIVRADTQASATLARRGIDAYGAPAMLSWRARLPKSTTEVLVYKDHRARKKREDRDKHSFACAMLAAFRGSEDADDFALALDASLGHVLPDAAHAIRFSRAMGPLEEWAPALVRRALARAAHDDVYGYWASALDEVWDDAMARSLEGVVAAPEVGARGLVAILEVACKRRHLGIVKAATHAVERLANDWSTSPDDERALRAVLAKIESQLDDATREGMGKLSVTCPDGAEGGLSVSRHAGGLEVTREEALDEVTLDFESTDERKGEEVEERSRR